MLAKVLAELVADLLIRLSQLVRVRLKLTVVCADAKFTVGVRQHCASRRQGHALTTIVALDAAYQSEICSRCGMPGQRWRKVVPMPIGIVHKRICRMIEGG